jgi:hypothetical protein
MSFRERALLLIDNDNTIYSLLLLGLAYCRSIAPLFVLLQLLRSYLAALSLPFLSGGARPVVRQYINGIQVLGLYHHISVPGH